MAGKLFEISPPLQIVVLGDFSTSWRILARYLLYMIVPVKIYSEIIKKRLCPDGHNGKDGFIWNMEFYVWLLY